MSAAMSSKISLVLLVFIQAGEPKLDRGAFKTLVPFRECLVQKHPGLCLKERALHVLNETMMSDEPLVLFDVVEVARNPQYHHDSSDDRLPIEVSARSSKLNDALYTMVEEYFKSRVVKFNMAPAFDEARGKKDKGKGGMMMLAMGGMAFMMAHMFMGKIAFMAGTAMMVAKLALFLSAIVGMKKMGNGGGGKETSHVVYAADGHGHGGGWHRSLNGDAHSTAYKAHLTDATGY